MPSPDFQPDPKKCLYSREHEWVLDGEDGSAWVGVSKFAAHELGDIVYVQLPNIGTAVRQFLKFGEIESVKAASDLYSPASGEVLETNEDLALHPELVNEDPFSKGWMLRISLANRAELGNLLDYDNYQAFLGDMLKESL